MSGWMYLLIGFVFAVVSVFVIRKLLPDKERSFWGLALVIAAAIYVVFALVGGAHDYLPMELGGILLYGTFAWLAVRHNLLWLAAGWALHVVWDVWLHSGEASDFVPTGYAEMCIGFDVALAVYLCWVVWGRREVEILQKMEIHELT